MNRLTALSALLALVSCFTPPAPPLERADFVLGGIPADSDSAEIRLSFGDPDSTTASSNPFGADPLVTWHYDGFEVRFAGGALPSGFMVTAPGESTPRGLRVGDDVERVLQLYGDPPIRAGTSWTWTYDDPERGLNVIDVAFDGATVTRIYLGRATG